MSENVLEEGNIKIELARNRSIKQYVCIVKNILSRVENEIIKERFTSETKKRNSVPRTAQFYTQTNIPESTINKCRHVLYYKDWLSIIESQNSTNLLETYCDDYRQFCRLHYIEKRQIPTLDKLISYFSKSVPYSVNVLEPLRSAGFTWKQLPGTKKAVIVEKPEQFYQRIQYLQNMKEWRQNNLPILYVEFIKYTDITNLNSKQNVVVAVSTLTGLVHITFMQKHFEFSMDWLMKWTANFIHKVKNPHVVVLGVSTPVTAENKVDHKEEDAELKMSSPKMDMVQWLEYNHIPHSPNDHRAELYRLVQKFRSICNPMQHIMEKIKSYGHYVVKQPRGIMDLTTVYANLKSKYWNHHTIQGNIYNSTFKNIFEGITLEDWITMDARIRKREEIMYQNDMEMEAVMDKLMELGKYGRISGREIDSLDDFTPLLGRNKYPQIVMID